MTRTAVFFGLLVMVTTMIGSCAADPAASPAAPDAKRPRVVATTTLVGDVVGQVGGDLVDLTVLMPPGADPHSYQPVPRDAARLAEADLVVINGLGFEAFLDDFLAGAVAEERILDASKGVETLSLTDTSLEDDHDHEGEAGHANGSADPHVWFDVANVRQWTENIEAALSALDPANAGSYESNAAQYRFELGELEAWIATQVELIPLDRRQLVTDHAVLGYFAHRYGFQEVGAIVPGFSTAAAPSARELADLQNSMASLSVSVLFVGATVNPDTAEQIAADAGVRVVPLFTGSLGEPGGPADSYLAFMRYNVDAIVGALRP